VQDQNIVRLHSERFIRASYAHQKWAEKATKCYDFFEGRQYTQVQLAAAAKDGKPLLTLNKIAPLVRLVMGYQENNQNEIKFLPGNDANSSQQVADCLNKVEKHESNRCQGGWVDTEVFLDGIVAGRGFFDDRLSFDHNDLGELDTTSVDPFSVFVDPDAMSYDTSEHSFITTSRWGSIDEIEYRYSPQVADLIRPLANGQSSWGGFLSDSSSLTMPVRTFGQVNDASETAFLQMSQDNLYDTQRKNVRIIDTQYKVIQWGQMFIDLETGDMEPVPAEWDEQKIQMALNHAKQVGNPLQIDFRPIEKVRWTVMVGDVIVHDCWSPYKTFTLRGFFPYFRRGVTRGMVEDLLDPQLEINKRRSALVDNISRGTNTGWVYTDKLTPDQKALIKNHGAKPGINIEFPEGAQEPHRLQPSPFPQGMAELEAKGLEDLREISGINESALGELDAAQSGRAIEARQRQAVISLQMYLKNFSRTKNLQGGKHLEIYQRFYNEPRIMRITGDDGKPEILELNKAVTDENGVHVASRINDVTVGKYSVSVDETPMSASFANAQYEEALAIIEKLGPIGQMLMQTKPELLIQMSSLPRKEEWVMALQQAMGMQQAAQMAQMQGAGVPAPAGPQTGGGGVK
jgi:hypothetical protein